MSFERYKELENKIKAYDYAFYNLNTSLVTDEEYDSIVKEFLFLKESYPDGINPGFVKSDSKKVNKIKEPMLSISKINEIDKFNKKIKEYKDGVIEDKYDGVAVRCKYNENGELVELTLRDDGSEGTDITDKKALIVNLPFFIENKTNEPIYITGECVCKKNEHLEYQKNIKKEQHPRHYVSGLLKREVTIDSSLELDIYFIAFHVSKVIRDKFKTYHPELRNWLETQGFGLPVLYNYLPKEKPEDIYPIDGVVLKKNKLKSWDNQKQIGYYDYACCFKYPTTIMDSTLESIGWSIGGDGRLNGVITIKPVTIMNISISRCQFHYADHYIKNGLYLGDKVSVTLGNECIPKLIGIKNLYKGNKIEFPKNCPCCNDPLQKVDKDLYCLSPKCEGRISSRLRRLVSKDGLNIDQLGDVKIDDLVNKGLINNINDIFSLDKEQLKEIGCGEKIIKKILLSIRNSKKLDFGKWLFGLAIPNLGVVRCITLKDYIVDNLPVNKQDEFVLSLLTDTKKMCELFGIDGIVISSFSIDNKEIILKFLSNYNFKSITKQRTDLIPIAITGKLNFNRNILKELFYQRGYGLDNIVTSKVKLLLLGSSPSAGKLVLAEKYSIPIVPLNDLKIEDMINLVEHYNV